MTKITILKNCQTSHIVSNASSVKYSKPILSVTQ